MSSQEDFAIVQQASPPFLSRFMLLSVLGGLTIGMGKVVTTFYAVHLGASSSQVGIIAAMEALGRLLVTLPAGFIIARFGARTVYFTSSLFPMLLNIAMPWLGAWYGVALLRALAGLAIPFRIVSMNSAFLQQLKVLGASRAGWYRGSHSLGMMLIGPLLGGWLVTHGSYCVSYLAIGALFGIMACYSRSLLPEEEAGHSGSDTGMMGEVRMLLRDHAVRDSCLVEVAVSAVTAVFSTFILLLATEVAGWSQQSAASLLMIQGVAIVAVSFGLGRLMHRYHPGQVQTVSLGLLALGLALIGTSATPLCLTLGAVLVGSGSALVAMARTLQLSRLAVSMSKVSGLYNLGNMAGALLGSLLGGLLADSVGLQPLFLVWIVPLMVAAVFCRVKMESSTA